MILNCCSIHLIQETARTAGKAHPKNSYFKIEGAKCNIFDFKYLSVVGNSSNPYHKETS